VHRRSCDMVLIDACNDRVTRITTHIDADRSKTVPAIDSIKLTLLECAQASKGLFATEL
jgi:hypothetical protein